MCGIIGTTKQLGENQVDQMLSEIIHRGPDEAGTYSSDTIPARMGVRRLSIIDREKGSQPIYNEDGSVAVVFNGEIYNYKELRGELIASGHSFQTDCDTEVLVHAWEEYGQDMPKHLDGMFAFAIADETAESIFIARDRIGIKPLYYSFQEDDLYWASEIQPLLHAGIDVELDEKAIYNYFNLRYFSWPQTPFSQIRKVPPGSSLLYEDGTISTQQYWKLESTEHDGDIDSFADQFRTMFEDSVKKRLMSDVPLGAFLSGGLDSSSIVAIMSEECEKQVNTFSVGFEDSTYDESNEAEFVADHFGTNHHNITIDLDSMDLFGDVVAQYGEPLSDPAALPTLAISEYASEHVKVVLSGEGADELFGGYWYTDKIPRHQHALRYVPDSVFQTVRRLEPHSPVRRQTLRYVSALENTDTAIRGVVQQFDTPPEEYLTLSDPRGENSLDSMIAATRNNVDQDTFSKRMNAFAIKHWLTDDLLYKVDQSSMAASLEARVPFLDHNLVEFAYKIPTEYKQNGYKPVVNQAMKDILPDRIRNRDKHGFSVPVAEWFRQDHYAITKWLDYDRVASTPYLNADKIHNIWAEHKQGADNSRILWKVLTYVAWYHQIAADSITNTSETMPS